jgi:hypothetical protein
MQPVRDLVVGECQVFVAACPYLHHESVIVGRHRSCGRATQRSDGNRAVIVRVVLVDRSCIEEADSRCEFRLDIHDLFARSEQLLAQQSPETKGAVDCPLALMPSGRPTQQTSALSRRCRGSELSEDFFVLSNSDRCV